MGKHKQDVVILKGHLKLIFLGSNIGVLQTTVAELVTVKEHQRKSTVAYCRRVLY